MGLHHHTQGRVYPDWLGSDLEFLILPASTFQVLPIQHTGFVQCQEQSLRFPVCRQASVLPTELCPSPISSEVPGLTEQALASHFGRLSLESCLKNGTECRLLPGAQRGMSRPPVFLCRALSFPQLLPLLSGCP